MSIIHSIILGLLEGLTEFLPISSTAHLDVARQLLGVADVDFAKSFEIIIQLGAVLAVVVLYWRKFSQGFWANTAKILTAFAPTALVGLLLYKIIKIFLLGNNIIMAAALGLGGLVLILWPYKQEADEVAEPVSAISYRQALIIGCCQSLAVVPGVSRAAATIIGGLALKIKRATIVEFSFLLAVPTMLAAGGWDIIKSGLTFTSGQISLLIIGFVVAFVSALAAVKFLINYIKKHNFVAFGWYRLAAAAALLWWIIR